jgi:hypothetical protein
MKNPVEQPGFFISPASQDAFLGKEGLRKGKI